MYPRMIQVSGDFSNLLEADYSEDFSCISHQVDEQQDVHDKYEWSTRYVKENTVINQLWWGEKDVPVKDLEHQLKILKLFSLDLIQLQN